MNATRADKQAVIDIIVKSFDHIPGIKWIIGNNGNREKRLRAMADFIFEKAFARDGVVLSADRQGVGIYFRFNGKKTSLRDYWNEIKFAFRCIGLARAGEIMNREKYILSQRPADGNYIYYWMFGVKPDARGNGAARELKNLIMEESRNQQLPIYLETTVEKNRRVYERYGFQLYHTWHVEKRNVTIWFMKKEPH